MAAVFVLAALAFWIVTRSWFILWMTVPELEDKLGGRVTIADAKYLGDGSVEFSDLKLRVPGIPGAAAEVADIGKAVIKIDAHRLWHDGLRISDIQINHATLRVSEDAYQSDILNIWRLHPKWVHDPSKPMLNPPRVLISDATLEFGWHDKTQFHLLGQRRVAGEMHPTPGARDLYNFTLNEIDPGGNGVPDGILIKGEWNTTSNEWVSRMDGLDLDDRIYRISPQVVRAMWSQMDLQGKVKSIEMTGRPDQPFFMKLTIDNVALTLPIDTETHWARYRAGTIETSTSRPRMHFSGGVIELTNHSLAFKNLTGVMGSSDTQEQVVAVPYRIDFSMPTLPPLQWENRDEWMKQLLATAAFNLKFHMDELSMKPGVAENAPAVDLPLIVARVLEKFQVTQWVLSTSVDVSRAEPTVDDSGKLVPAKTITTGQALLHNASGEYQKFPYRLDDVDAYLQFDNDRVTVQYLTGTGSNGCKIRVSGEIAPPDNDARVSLRLQGTDVPVDDRLRSALNNGELEAFEMLFNKESAQLLGAAGLLPDQHALEIASSDIASLKRELETVKQNAANDASAAARASEIESRIARLQRSVDAGPFTLGGTVNLDLKIDREAGPHQRTITTGKIDVKNVGMLYRGFPYPLRVTGGSLDWQKDRVAIVPGANGDGLTLITPGGGKGSVTGELELHAEGESHRMLPNLAIKFDDDEFNDSVYAAIPLSERERQDLASASDPQAAQWPGTALSRVAQLVKGVGLHGPASYAGTIASDPDGKINYNVALTLDNCTAQPKSELARLIGARDERWPAKMQIENVTGSLQISRERVAINQVSGNAGEIKVGVNGEVDLRDDLPKNAIQVNFENLPLDSYVLNVCAPEQAPRAEQLWRQYQPRGIFDAALDYRTGSNGDPDATLRLKPVDVSLAVGGQRVSVKQIDGTLAYHRGAMMCDEWTVAVADEGGLPQGELRLNGIARVEQAKNDFDFHGSWLNGRFDSPLIVELMNGLDHNATVTNYRACNPMGEFDADFQIAAEPGAAAPNWRFEVAPKSLGMQWNDRPIVAKFDSGSVTLTPDHVQVQQVRGHAPDGEFALDGAVNIAPAIEAQLQIGYRGSLRSEAVEAFLPQAVKDALDQIKFSDSGATTLRECQLQLTEAPQVGAPSKWNIAFKGPVTTSSASVQAGVLFTDLQGTAEIDVNHTQGRPLMLNVSVEADRARAMGQWLSGLETRLSLSDDGQTLNMPMFRAAAGDGVITAQASTGMQEHSSYQANIDMVGVPLNRFSVAGGSSALEEPADRKRKGSTGEVFANMTISGERDDDQSRRGRGTVRVLHGKMVTIPLFVQLMQVMQLTMPLGGNLDYADANMYLVGDRLIFERLMFESSVGEMSMLQLIGEGEIDVNTLELRTRFRSRGAVPILRDIVGEVGDALYCIEVTGPLGDPRARIVPLPAAEPLAAGFTSPIGR